MTMEASKAASKLEELTKALEKEGVDVGSLTVCMMGDEQFLGSVHETQHREGGVYVKVRDPKRIIRIQQIHEGNLRIEFTLVDLDYIEKGEVEVYATAFYRLEEQSLMTRLRMYVLYLQYFESKKMMRAAAAGIQVPKIQLPEGIGSKSKAG